MWWNFMVSKFMSVTTYKPLLPKTFKEHRKSASHSLKLQENTFNNVSKNMWSTQL